MLDSFVEQWNRAFPNSPTFYICCVITSVLAVIVTYIFTTESKQQQPENITNDETQEFGLQARYKLAKHNVVKEQLTPEQQSEERRSDTEALAAIYKLLHDRKDLFPEATMDDIKSQLNLYKCTE